MPKYAFLLLFLVVTTLKAFSMNQDTLIKFHVQGRVVSKADKVPIQYATIMAVNTSDSTDSYVTTSGKDGHFDLPILRQGQFRMKYSCIGFKAVYRTVVISPLQPSAMELNVQELEGDDNLLKEVSVISKKPLLYMRDDKIIYNVEGKQKLLGSNTYDILNKTPGVIARDNTVQINGKSNILILINGQKQFLTADQAIQYIKSLPVDQIKEIEVLAHPSAKYDMEAAGGVINIVLAKPVSAGLAGSSSAVYSQGKYPAFSPGVNLIYNDSKTIYSGSYNHVYSEQYATSTSNQTSSDGSSPLILNSVNSLKRSQSDVARLNIDHTFANKSLLSFTITSNWNYGKGDATNITDIVSQNTSQVTNQLERSHPANKSWFGNLYYNAKSDSGKKEITLNLNYGRLSNTPEINYLQQIDNISGSGSTYNTINLIDSRNSSLSLVSFSGNYAVQLNKHHSLETGLKLSYTTNESNVDFDTVMVSAKISDPFISTSSKYKEFIPAYYLNYNYSKDRFSYTLGTRIEATLSDVNFISDHTTLKQRLFNIYPNLNLSYRESSTNKTSFSFNKGIFRPGYFTMNPVISYYNPVTYYQGNPALKPSTYYDFSLQQAIHNKYFITIGYSYTRDGVTEVYNRDQNDQTKITYVNLNSTAGYNINSYIPLSPFKWWDISNNISLYYLHYLKYDTALFPDINKGNFIVKISSDHEFSLPGKFYGDAYFYYISPNRFNQTYLNSYVTIDLGLKKTFGYFTIYTQVQDITNAVKRKGTAYYNAVINETYLKDDTRRFRLSLSYRFGNKKVKGTKQRQTGSETEQNRTKSNEEQIIK